MLKKGICAILATSIIGLGGVCYADQSGTAWTDGNQYVSSPDIHTYNVGHTHISGLEMGTSAAGGQFQAGSATIHQGASGTTHGPVFVDQGNFAFVGLNQSTGNLHQNSGTGGEQGQGIETSGPVFLNITQTNRIHVIQLQGHVGHISLQQQSTKKSDYQTNNVISTNTGIDEGPLD